MATIAHNWNDHEHHTGSPLELTQDDYEAALKAVENDTVHQAAKGRVK